MSTATMARTCQHIRRWVVTQNLGDFTDRKLLERFTREEDEAAFAIVVRRHAGLVLGACRAVLQHQQDAEDAFQATFLVLARKAGSVAWQESVAGWLFETARHMALKVRSHAARRRLHEVAMEDLPPVDNVANLAWGELRSILDEELSRLPEKYRAALVLCHMEGKSRSEAARELGWKEGAVKIRLERGRDLLRVRLTRRGLALSTGLLGTMLSTSALSAMVPARLMESTVKAATCYAAGKEAAAGLVSAEAAALAKGGLGAMAFSKSKMVALTLAALLVTAGTGISLHRPAVAQSVAALDADTAKPAADSKAAAQDQYGDALPQGAKMRFGTLRLRHGGPVYFVGFAAKGKELVTAGQDCTVRVWELPSGKELRRIGKPAQAAAGVGAMPNIAIAGGNAMMAPRGQAGSSQVALSADGQTLAIAAADGTVQLYEVATGKQAGKIQAGPGLGSMVFASDAKSLATRSNTGVIQQWEIATGKEIRKYGTPVNNQNGVIIIVNNGLWVGGGGGGIAFSPDGKTIAGQKSNFDPKNQKATGEVQLWSVETGKEIKSLKDDQANGFAGSSAIAFAPNSKTLAWASSDGTVHLFDSESSKDLRTLGDKGGAISAQAFAPDGKSLAVQGNDKLVRVYDVENGKELRQLGDKEADARGAGGFVVASRFVGGGSSQSLAYSPDGDVLAVAGSGNTVRLWAVATGKEILPVASGHQGGVSPVAVSPDGKTLISCGADHVVRLWDMATGKEIRQFKLPAEAANAVFSPNGGLLAFATADTIRVWDVAKGSEVQTMKLPAAPANPFGFKAGVSLLAFSPDDKVLASRGFESKIRLWDVASGAETRVLDEPLPKEQGNPAPGGLMIRGFGTYSAGIAFSSDGGTVAAVTSSQNVGAWGVANVQIGGGRANNAVKPMARFWHVLTGKQVRQFVIDKPAQAFVLSPDDRNLATLNGDGTISIWEVASGKERCQFKAGGTLLRFAKDGHTLAVAGNDRKIALYDIRTGKQLGHFDGHQGAILSLAFSPDATAVLSGSADSTILSWDLTTLTKEGRPQAVALEAKQVESLWTNLADQDAKKAYQAVVALSLDPKQVAWLKEQLKPAAGVDPKRIDQLIADLDDNNFQVRQRAADELEKLGELAEPALEKVLKNKPNLDLEKRIQALLEKIVTGKEPPASIMQALRGLEVLEEIGGSEARQTLEKMAQGAAGAQVTRAAQSSLQRLNGR
jgi:RNA polymerase sigma factor (sigma-70 family)